MTTKLQAIQKISPFLWFNTQAEEAAEFYVSIFPDSKITKRVISPIDTPSGKKGTLMTVAFELSGQAFTGINGGPHFTFNPAISFVISCETQKEVDAYWEKLLAGGKPSQCGWLTDRFGVSWQVVPTILPELMASPDAAKAQRVAAAMMKMVKLDIDGLKKAAEAK